MIFVSRSTDTKAIADGFINYLTRQGKSDLLAEVISQLSKSAAAGNKVTVESFEALSTAQKKKVEILLHRKFGKNYPVEFKTNGGILGGLKISLGDRVLDLTLKGKLERVVNSLFADLG